MSAYTMSGDAWTHRFTNDLRIGASAEGSRAPTRILKLMITAPILFTFFPFLRHSVVLP